MKVVTSRNDVVFDFNFVFINVKCCRFFQELSRFIEANGSKTAKNYLTCRQSVRKLIQNLRIQSRLTRRKSNNKRRNVIAQMRVVARVTDRRNLSVPILQPLGFRNVQFCARYFELFAVAQTQIYGFIKRQNFVVLTQKQRW